jgi:hypothetical protein
MKYPWVAKALAAIEVRSSKFDAQVYMTKRQEQIAEVERQMEERKKLTKEQKKQLEKESGQKFVKKYVGRETPSFTVKVEDLVIVYRWLQKYKVPQAYCQVFFDSIYAINFINIFRRIADGKFEIETPAKSQEKATIMIPITAKGGFQVGRATSKPKFTAKEKVTELGRHDAYVVPQGGGFELNQDNMRRALLEF